MSDSVRPHRWQPTRLPRPWDSPGKNTGVGCHFLLQCMKVKSESEVAQSCPTLATPWTAAHQASPSMGFSKQKYWSEVPLPSLLFFFFFFEFLIKNRKAQRPPSYCQALPGHLVGEQPSLMRGPSLAPGQLRGLPCLPPGTLGGEAAIYTHHPSLGGNVRNGRPL